MNQIDIVVPDGSMNEIVTGLFAKAGMPIAIQRERIKESKICTYLN